MISVKKAGIEIVIGCLVVLSLATTGAAASRDDLAEKIKYLELQIQELKQLKFQQKMVDEKEQQCVRVTGEEKLCSCLAAGLPKEVSFEQYVHYLVTSKEDLKYESLKPEVQQAVDVSAAVRKRCINK